MDPSRQCGVQYLSIRCSERLADAKIASSAGGGGDSYGNALAETIEGSYEAEAIHRRSWRGAVEPVTLRLQKFPGRFNRTSVGKQPELRVVENPEIIVTEKELCIWK